MEALFRAYFTEGRDLSERRTLIDIAAQAGLDRGQAEAELNSAEGQPAIEESHQLSGQLGVEGVPFFLINGKIKLSGAQPPEVFVTAFGHALES